MDNFENEKYEYILLMKGEFFNEEYVNKHGFKEQTKYFDTIGELRVHKHNLSKLAKELNVYFESRHYGGKDVRYRNVAEFQLIYQNHTFDLEKEFDYYCGADSIKWEFLGGNYACDCNKARFINSKYGTAIPETCDTNNIQLKNLIITNKKLY